MIVLSISPALNLSASGNPYAFSDMVTVWQFHCQPLIIETVSGASSQEYQWLSRRCRMNNSLRLLAHHFPNFTGGVKKIQKCGRWCVLFWTKQRIRHLKQTKSERLCSGPLNSHNSVHSVFSMPDTPIRCR